MNTPSSDEQMSKGNDPAVDAVKAIDRPTAALPASSANDGPEVLATREQRVRMAAYAMAEQRGFEPGFETEDWLEAERRIDDEDTKGSVRDDAN